MSIGKIEYTPEGWVFWKSNVTKSRSYPTKQAAEDAYNEWRIGPDGPDGPDKGRDPDDDDTPGGKGSAGGAGIDPAVADAFRNRGGFGREGSKHCPFPMGRRKARAQRRSRACGVSDR